MLITDSVAAEAAQYLTAHDPALAPVIAQLGLCPIRPHGNYYQELADSIISQQLSVKAAKAIEQRFEELFGGHFPSPEEILTKDIEELRAIGLSRPKAGYIQDLAQHILDGKLSFENIDTLSNEEVIQQLTAVKGIGEWTAHMFLMFCMARSDILPVGDLGIRNSMRSLYGLDHAPTPDDIKAIAQQNQWHPYESIASWYIWKSLDNIPAL